MHSKEIHVIKITKHKEDDNKVEDCILRLEDERLFHTLQFHYVIIHTSIAKHMLFRYAQLYIYLYTRYILNLSLQPASYNTVSRGNLLEIRTVSL